VSERSGQLRKVVLSGVLAAVGLGALFVSPSIPAATRTDLQERVATILEQEGLAGAVWVTVEPEGGIVTGAAGVRDARSGEPMEAGDRVHVGSIAKTLLATGVLRLATQGRLALDAPVSEVLPDVVFDNPWADSDPVRIRHLLDHTSGLDDLRLWQFFSTGAGPDTPLAQAFAGKGLLRVRSRPGTRFSYSNMGYTLLGRVIESVAGERHERHLDAHLLAPLGMHDSTFGFTTQQGPDADPRLAMGHFEDGTAHAAAPIYLRPARQFTTTAHDMGVFARFLMGDGRIDGEAFIDPRWLRGMGTARGTEAAQAGLQVGYALGLGTRDRYGVVGRWHGGSIVGYRASLYLFPEQQRAFFWSINTDSESPGHHRRLDELFIQALAVAAPAPAPEAGSAPVDIDGWDGFYVPAPNRMASFAWVDTVFGFVHLRREGAGLRLRGPQTPETLLTPMGGRLLRAPGRTIASHALVTAADGSRVLSTGQQNLVRVPASKLALLWASLAAGVLGLVYLLLSGSARLLSRGMTPKHPAFVPFLGVVALLLPLPLFLRQSFLQLGDVTAASVLLSIVTAALPLAMVAGLAMQLHRRCRGTMAVLDTMAMLAVLQWSLVLAAWGMLPLRLWG
jgi:CubicO group peptidase (beta-lactamase class C family)